MTKRTKLGQQIYNTRKMMRAQMEKIALCRDDLSVLAVQEMGKCEQILFKIEIGMWGKKFSIVDDDSDKPDEPEKA